LAQAVARELREEGNIEMTAPPRLHGIFFNNRASRRDHVALFVVRAFRQLAAPVPNGEIIAHGFFAADVLPNDTTAATRARLPVATLLRAAERRYRGLTPQEPPR